MTGTLLDNFARLVSANTGLCIRERDLPAFRNKLLERIRRRCSCETEYFRLLELATPESAREWSALAGLLTTGESYFFRDKEQFELLKNRILPELIANGSIRRRLRIWSAGCSTGEEPYSLAIVLKELLPRRDDWRILVLGTDIDDQALEQARGGIYTQWSFRSVPTALRNRYFSQRKQCWIIDEGIRSMVTFGRCNLVRDTFPDRSMELHDMDLILCRNVFIYFNKDAVASVVQKFAGVLNEGGYLLTGHGELPLQASNRFATRMLDDQVILRKVAEPGAGRIESGARRHATPPEPRGPAAGKPLQRTWLPMPRPGGTGIGRAEGPTMPAAPVETERMGKGAPADLEELLARARSHADQGNYDRAAEKCRRAMALDAVSSRPYFLLAQIAEACGHPEEAKDLLKKTIYLEPDHLAAHMELGALYLKEGNVKLAGKMLSAARCLLLGRPSGGAVPDYGYITVGELLRHADTLLAGLNEKEAPRGNGT